VTSGNPRFLWMSNFKDVMTFITHSLNVAPHITRFTLNSNL
jgi:hypothetical protein